MSTYGELEIKFRFTVGERGFVYSLEKRLI